MHHKGLALIIAVGIILVAYFAILAWGKPEAPVTVSLYYYDTFSDRDETGNPRCSADSVVPVARTLPQSETIIADTISLLLSGDLSASERAQGLSTEFPRESFKLVSAELYNGILTLRFDDPENFSSGGSCRVTLLRAQVEKTALQFQGVSVVRFSPPELFQP